MHLTLWANTWLIKLSQQCSSALHQHIEASEQIRKFCAGNVQNEGSSCIVIQPLSVFLGFIAALFIHWSETHVLLLLFVSRTTKTDWLTPSVYVRYWLPGLTDDPWWWLLVSIIPVQCNHHHSFHTARVITNSIAALVWLLNYLELWESPPSDNGKGKCCVNTGNEFMMGKVSFIISLTN